MKQFTLILVLFISQFVFAQKIYTNKQVDVQPTFSGCNNKIDKDCFNKKIISRLTEQITDFITTLPKGKYSSVVEFTINEDGKFSNYTSKGNKKLGEKSITALKNLILNQNVNKLKVIPANIKGKSVKMKYSLPVKIVID
jgi:hypothetical protein